jgi:hypothetical protein
MLQLNPPIYVTTPLGEGHAIVLLDYGPSINTVWVVHLFADGRVVHVDSSEVRLFGNPMYGISHPEPPQRSMQR